MTQAQQPEALQTAIRLLREAAQEYAEGVSVNGVPDWKGEPDTADAYDETMAAVVALEAHQAEHIALQQGYDAARLEIEALRKREGMHRMSTLDGICLESTMSYALHQKITGTWDDKHYPELPKSAGLVTTQEPITVSGWVKHLEEPGFTEDQLRAYADATCALRAQADSQPALPKITAEDRSFLHYNPNTDDIVEWVQHYASAAITADRAMRAQAAPAAVAGPKEAVAYLDIGEGGYLDLGSDLSDEALRKLPKGRHMLAIVGTYGVDGYVPVAAPTTQAAPQPAVKQGGAAPFQQRVQPWMLECFGAEISADRAERNHRFLEEALELVQSTGCSASEAHQLVDYVYGRPVGEPEQEVGGVMVTLAALCLANRLDMHVAADVELARIWTKVETIRAKQAAKPKHSPLPAAPVAQGDARAEQSLLKVLTAVQRYLPPDGPSAKDTLSEIIGIVDPWPLGDLKGKA